MQGGSASSEPADAAAARRARRSTAHAKEAALGKQVAPVSYSDNFYSAFGITREQAAAVKLSAAGGTSAGDAALATRGEDDDDDDVDLSSQGLNADAEAALEAEKTTGQKQRLPRVSSSDLFKLRGSASGKLAINIIRQKEVERRAAELKKKGNKDKKVEKAAQQRRDDVLAANRLLLDVSEASEPKTTLLKANKDPLCSLLRIYGVAPPQGKAWQSIAKPAVLEAVRALLLRDDVGTPEQRPQLREAAATQLRLTMAPAAAS